MAEAVTASRSSSAEGTGATAVEFATGDTTAAVGAAALVEMTGRAVAPTNSTREAMPMRFRVAVSWFERFVIGAFKLHQHRRSTSERSTRPRFAGRGLTISRFIPLHTMS